MSGSPFVSVLMPVYNGGEYLSTAIDSILNQTYTDFEFLIIDDGSTDNSLSIIKQYQQKDDRIRIIVNDTNKGLVYSLNTGFDQARGKYIARMDADDISVPNRFQMQVDFMEQHPHISVLGTQIKIIGNSYIPRRPTDHFDIKTEMLYWNNIAHPTVFIRKKDLVDKKLVFRKDYFPAEDYKLWIDAIESGLKLASLHQVGLEYRIHETQISSSQTPIQHKLTRQIEREYAQSLFGKDINEEDIAVLTREKIYTLPISSVRKVFNRVSQSFTEKANFTRAEFEMHRDKRMQTFGKKRFVKEALASQPNIKDKLSVISIFVIRIFKKKK